MILSDIAVGNDDDDDGDGMKIILLIFYIWALY